MESKRENGKEKGQKRGREGKSQAQMVPGLKLQKQKQTTSEKQNEIGETLVP